MPAREAPAVPSDPVALFLFCSFDFNQQKTPSAFRAAGFTLCSQFSLRTPLQPAGGKRKQGKRKQVGIGHGSAWFYRQDRFKTSNILTLARCVFVVKVIRGPQVSGRTRSNDRGSANLAAITAW